MRLFATPTDPDPMNRVTTNGFGGYFRASRRFRFGHGELTARRFALALWFATLPSPHNVPGKSRPRRGGAWLRHMCLGSCFHWIRRAEKRRQASQATAPHLRRTCAPPAAHQTPRRDTAGVIVSFRVSATPVIVWSVGMVNQAVGRRVSARCLAAWARSSRTSSYECGALQNRG